MGLIPLSVAVMAITLVVLAAFMIPAFIELRKTAAAAREFLVGKESELKPIIRDLQEAMADLRVLTQGAAENVDEVKVFMESVGDAGRSIQTINTVVGGVATVIGRSSLWLTGAKVAGKFIIDRISKKRG
jgi:uncharacterized protein YoxC